MYRHINSIHPGKEFKSINLSTMKTVYKRQLTEKSSPKAVSPTPSSDRSSVKSLDGEPIAFYVLLTLSKIQDFVFIQHDFVSLL